MHVAKHLNLNDLPDSTTSYPDLISFITTLRGQIMTHQLAQIESHHEKSKQLSQSTKNMAESNHPMIRQDQNKQLLQEVTV